MALLNKNYIFLNFTGGLFDKWMDGQLPIFSDFFSTFSDLKKKNRQFFNIFNFLKTFFTIQSFSPTIFMQAQEFHLSLVFILQADFSINGWMGNYRYQSGLL